MKKIEKKIINETIESKIDDLMGKVKSKMDEGGFKKPKRPRVEPEDYPEYDETPKFKKPKRVRVEPEDYPEYDETPKFKKPKRVRVEPEDNPKYGETPRLRKPKRPMVKQEKNPDLDEDISDKVEVAMQKLRDKGYFDREDEDIDDSLMESVQNIVSEIKIREFKGKRKSKKSVIMSESELISFIKELVVEEAKANGIKEVDRVRKSNNSDAQSYLKELTKKLKDYASVDVKKDVKDFPDRNKSEVTKAYRNSKEDDEFVDDFAKNGVEAFIEPEDYEKNRNKDYVEGSSETGNSDEYANSVKTDVNKNIGKRIKKGALKKEKEKSYNKDPQPTTSVKESLKDEFDRINEMIYYNKRTQ